MNIIKNMFLLAVCLMICGCASDKRKIVDSYRHEQISQNRVWGAFGEPYNKIINKNGTETWYYRKSNLVSGSKEWVSGDEFTIIIFDADKNMSGHKKTYINYARPVPAGDKKPTGVYDYTDMLSAMGNNINFDNAPQTVVIE
ncbi:MAG: hypothetical protein K2L95_04580 [Alphaproteobacteria bacterium]|nr:hypothetical protein [Alphaproteobacteria bacterium]